MQQDKFINPHKGTIQASPEAGLSTFRISKHELSSQPVAPSIPNAKAWLEGWYTQKPRLCA